MTETRDWPRLALGALIIACGAIAYGLTAAIDAYMGGVSSIDDTGKILQGGTMLLVSAFAFLFALSSGVMWARRYRVFAAALFVVAAFFGTYSWSNGVTFFAIQSIGKVELAKARHDAKAKAINDANKTALTNQAGTLAWLKGLTGQAEGRKEKQRLIDEVVKASRAPVEIREIPVTELITDTKAMVYSRLTGGVDQTSIQLMFAIGAAVLLYLGKLLSAVGPAIMGASYRARENKQRRGLLRWLFESGEKEAPARPVAPPTPTLPIDLPQPVRTIDLDRERDMALIREWLGSGVTRVAPNIMPAAEDVFGWFRGWYRRAKQGTCRMTQTRFGRLMAQLDIPKERRSGRVVYRGLAQRGEQQGVRAA